MRTIRFARCHRLEGETQGADRYGYWIGVFPLKPGMVRLLSAFTSSIVFGESS
jgi:hypothetical protein